MFDNLKNFLEENRDLIISLYANDKYCELINIACKNLTKEKFDRFLNTMCEIDILSKTQCCGLKNIELYFWKRTGVSLITNDIYKLKEDLINFQVKVVVDYKGEKIKVFFINKKIEAICENSEQKMYFDKFSEKTLEKAKNGGFKDLLHFINYHTIEKIKYVQEPEMRQLWLRIDEQLIINDKENGLRIDELTNDKENEKKNELRLLGFYREKNVYLCRDLIDIRAGVLQKTYEKELCCKCKNEFDLLYKSMFDLLYTKVFTHEFGHLVFDWVGTKDRVKAEKQANYFSSYITDGEIDEFILWFTKQQPKEYKDPYLIGNSKVEALYR